MGNKKQIKDKLRGLLDPAVSFLSYLNVPPIYVTSSGIVLSAVGAVFVGFGRFFIGGLFLLASGLCDVLDGSLARRENKVSSFGAFIDSTGDRVTELMYYGAIILFFSSGGHTSKSAIVLSLVALGGSFLTSYTRARSEGLGIPCTVGMLERPERLAILVVGLLFGSRALFVALIILSVLTVYTAIQRVAHVKKSALEGDGGRSIGNQ